MPETLGQANIIIGASLDKLDRDLSDARNKIGNALENIAKITAGITIGGLAALAGGLAAAVGEAMGAQEAMARLDATLNALGDQAAVGRDALLDYAGALQDTTRFSDETVMAAEAVLLQFTSLSEETFPQALQAAADLAAGLGIDLPGAAQMLGRAMEDPDLAIRSLRAANILLTDAEQEQLKAMQEAGDVAGAQALILGRVERAYGGAAEAAGQTFAGQIDRLKNKFSDIMEQIGGAVLPLLQQLADWLVNKLNDPAVQAWIAGLSQKLSEAADYIGTNVLPVLAEIATTIIDRIGEAVQWLSDHQAVVAGILGVIAAAFLAWGINAGIAAASTIVALAPVIAIIAAIGAAVGLFYAAWTENWGGIRDKLAAAWDTISPVLSILYDTLSRWWEEAMPKIRQALSDAWAFIEPILTTLLDAVVAVFGAIVDFIADNQETIKSIFSSAWDIITGVLSTAWTIISGIFTVIGDLLRGDWSAAWEDFKTAIGNIWAGIQQIIESAVLIISGVLELAWNAIRDAAVAIWGEIGAGIESAFRDVVEWLKGRVHDIEGFFTGLAEKMFGIGAGIVRGLWDGLQSIWNDVKNWFDENVGGLIRSAGDLLGIHSPSAVFADFGRQIGAGLVVGLQKSMDDMELAVQSMAQLSVEAVGESNSWTVNVYPQQSTNSALSDILVARALLGV